MSTRSPLRTFFEQELEASNAGFQQDGLTETPPTEHVASHLVEQTVCRAALDAATQRPMVEYSSDGPMEVSWERCLMVAALTELRPVKLLGRN